MSFERSDFQDPPQTAKQGSRKMAAVLIPLVAAVPVAIALVGRSNDGGPTADELNAMLGAQKPDETQAEAVTEAKEEALPPEDLASVSGLPGNGDGDSEAPPGPVDPGKVAETAANGQKTEDSGDGVVGSELALVAPVVHAGEQTAEPAAAAAEAIPTAHTVEPGDTLYGIGQKYGKTPEDIAEANGIAVTDPIRPGQEIIVPGAGRVGSGGAGDTVVAGIPGPQPAGPTQRTIPHENLPSGGAAGVPDHGSTTNPASQEPVPVSGETARNSGGYTQTETRTDGGGATGGYYPVTGGSGGSTTSVGPRYCIGYVVHRGDTLDSIAYSHSTTSSVIQAMNGVSRVSPGQVIVVPVDGIMTPCR